MQCLIVLNVSFTFLTSNAVWLVKKTQRRHTCTQHIHTVVIYNVLCNIIYTLCPVCAMCSHGDEARAFDFRFVVKAT